MDILSTFCLSLISSPRIWSQDDCGFVGLSDTEVSQALAVCDPLKLCLSCGQSQLQEQAAEVQFSPGMFSQFGTEYHIGDFVYVRPKSNPDVLFDLAQVKRIKGTPDRSRSHGVQVTVQLLYLGRVDKIVRRASRGKEFEQRSYVQDEVSTSHTITHSLICE